MKSEDAGRFAMAIGKLCVAYNRAADDALIEVYGEVLGTRRIEDIEAAVKKVLGDAGEFMPPPGVLRKLALSAAAKRNNVAFIEGTGWISLTGDPSHGDHPDNIDAREDRKRIAAAKTNGHAALPAVAK